MFTKAFLTGYTDMVKTSNDLDRLKYAPQRVEAGVFYNFKNKDMFSGVVTGLADLTIELIKAERVNEATRFTAALQKEYFTGFDKMIGLIAVDNTEAEQKVDPVQELYNKLYDVVAAGDKKSFRSLRKELKDQWFALDGDTVEDAIFDLGDAVADKDVNLAKEIIEGLDEDETPAKDEPTPEPEVKDIAENTPKVKKAAPKKTTKLTDEESAIIEDLKSAIDDGDQKDIDELLAELKEVNEALYDEWYPAPEVEHEAPKSEVKDDTVTDEIIEELDAAIADGDDDEAKACLEELADEVGVDSEVYKENAAKLAPKRKRTRRGK